MDSPQHGPLAARCISRTFFLLRRHRGTGRRFFRRAARCASELERQTIRIFATAERGLVPSSRLAELFEAVRKKSAWSFRTAHPRGTLVKADAMRALAQLALLAAPAPDRRSRRSPTNHAARARAPQQWAQTGVPASSHLPLWQRSPASRRCQSIAARARDGSGCGHETKTASSVERRYPRGMFEATPNARDGPPLWCFRNNPPADRRDLTASACTLARTSLSQKKKKKKNRRDDASTPRLYR